MRRTALIAAASAAALALPAAAIPAAAAPPKFSTDDARLGGSWLAHQLTPAGYARDAKGKPSPSDTAGVVLALAAAGLGPVAQQHATAWLAKHVNLYVRDKTGKDKAGELATLILVADSQGTDPTRFGGTNLVKRLQKTQHKTGADAGLYGSQDPTYDGAYRQGLALLALSTAKANNKLGVGWLVRQECADGGWSAHKDPGAACAFEDTNSTALAVESLATLGRAVGRGVRWLHGQQLADGGWGYGVSTPQYPTSADPDSTAVVIQGLIAAGKDLTSSAWRKKGGTAFTALDSFELGCLAPAKQRGAYFYPGGIKKPNLLATEQAVVAAAGKAFPLGHTEADTRSVHCA